MKVEVIRSPRRRKTVELRPTPDGVRISIPARASRAEEERYVKELLAKYQRQTHPGRIDLKKRAHQLAASLGLPEPQTIKWVDNQRHRWGSCTPSLGAIRISSNVQPFPAWVVDYVIVHEMAHLVHLGHTDEFWDLVARYPLAERARGYLIAKAGHQDESAFDMDSDVEDTNEVAALDESDPGLASDKTPIAIQPPLLPDDI